MGPHSYEGRFLKGYGFTVCRTCYDANWDGWQPGREVAIEAHLASISMPPPPTRNANGLYPREWPTS